MEELVAHIRHHAAEAYLPQQSSSSSSSSSTRILLTPASIPRRKVEAMMKLYLCHATSLPDDDTRYAAWKCLLGAHAIEEAEVPQERQQQLQIGQGRIASVEQNLPNQRVITVDAERTKPDIAAFRNPIMLARIRSLLTFYCKEGYLGGIIRTSDTPLLILPSRGSPTTTTTSSSSSSSSFSSFSGGVPYRQGLNELLAPFLMLETTTPLSDEEVMSIFSRLVARYAPRVFANSADSDFISLQCALRLLCLLLQYHDPKLATFLEQFQCQPELYATPWFLTLFARGLAKTEMFVLWDFLVSCCRRPGPAILHAISVAFLISHRETILRTSTRGATASDLPLIMSRLVFTDVQHVRRVCAHALEILAATPITFRRLILNVCYSGGPGLHDRAEAVPVSPALLTRLEKRMCIKIGIEEVLLGAGSRFAATPAVQGALVRARDAIAALRNNNNNMNMNNNSTSGSSSPLGFSTPSSSTFNIYGLIASTTTSAEDDPDASGFQLLRRDDIYELPPRFLLIDVRSKEEFEYGGHLPTAFHVSPDLLQDPEQLDEIMKTFKGLKGVHFAIMGSGDVSQWYRSPVPHTAVMSDVICASLVGSSGGGGSGNNNHNNNDAAKKQTENLGAGEGKTISSSTSTSSSSRSLLLPPLSIPSTSTTSKSSSSSSLSSSSTPRLPTAKGADEAEYAALELGLEPLSANEDDDYGGQGDATRALIALFLQRGFNRVCEVEGGFTALHQHQALFVDEVLVGHDRAYCMVCSGGTAAAMYAGRNAVERGELIQDAAPFRQMGGGSGGGAGGGGAGSGSGGGGATGGSAQGAALLASKRAAALKRDNSMSSLHDQHGSSSSSSHSISPISTTNAGSSSNRARGASSVTSAASTPSANTSESGSSNTPQPSMQKQSSASGGRTPFTVGDAIAANSRRTTTTTPSSSSTSSSVAGTAITDTFSWVRDVSSVPPPTSIIMGATLSSVPSPSHATTYIHTSSNAPNTSPTQLKQQNVKKNPLLIGYDAHGFPILSEIVHLELQLDALEAAHESGMMMKQRSSTSRSSSSKAIATTTTTTIGPSSSSSSLQNLVTQNSTNNNHGILPARNAIQSAPTGNTNSKPNNGSTSVVGATTSATNNLLKSVLTPPPPSSLSTSSSSSSSNGLNSSMNSNVATASNSNTNNSVSASTSMFRQLLSPPPPAAVPFKK